MKRETILVKKKEVYSRSHRSKEIYYEFKTALGYFRTKVAILGNFKGQFSDKDFRETQIENVHERALDEFQDSNVYPSDENFNKRIKEEKETENKLRKCEEYYVRVCNTIKGQDLSIREGQPREVVYNSTFGGFTLSEKAFCIYARLKYGDDSIRNLDDIKNFKTSIVELKGGRHIAYYDLVRHDPLLVAVVKEVEFNERNPCSLKICKVEGKYYISEYDGRERVFDSKKLRPEDGWFNTDEKQFINPTEVEVVTTENYSFRIKSETFCRYVLGRFELSSIKNLDKIKSFQTTHIEYKDGRPNEIDSVFPRHDPLLVELVRELELDGENQNKLEIKTVIGPYWVNDDSDYPEKIVEYDDLDWR